MKLHFKLNTSELENNLQKIKNNTADNLGKAVLAGLFTLEGYAKLNIRDNFNQGTGFLAANWETKLDSQSNENAEGHTSPLAVYARIHELGGVIRATNAEALVFQTKDGQWHRVKAVTIPARPYLRPAADEHSQDVFDAVSVVLGDAMEKS